MHLTKSKPVPISQTVCVFSQNIEYLMLFFNPGCGTRQGNGASDDGQVSKSNIDNVPASEV